MVNRLLGARLNLRTALLVAKSATIALAIALLLLFPSRLNSGDARPRSTPHYTEQDRDAAVERGLQFMYKVASNPQYFSRWGPDLMFCFYTISSTARNERLREMALRMGQELATQWRRERTNIPAGNPDELALFRLRHPQCRPAAGRPQFRPQTSAHRGRAPFLCN